ncbi:hypothetical protein [Cronobacter dublinensis]|uniref:hypothetical protein n=1 Tax=Cronobacter dublinensis TaxID=413497 RepID=UPI000CFB6B14|nr:hypothetical protein [Cronobacter dublinensis]
MTDTAKLKAAALAAGGEEWAPRDQTKNYGEYTVIVKGSLETHSGCTSYRPIAEGVVNKQVMKFIALANPAAVLELIAAQPQTAAARDVLAERQRQISAEGWTPQHDDEHDNNELAFAAACYAFHAAAASLDLEDTDVPYDSHPAPKNWPWDTEWWKPKSARADLVRAAALIVAEIERIDRAAGINLETGGEA